MAKGKSSGKKGRKKKKEKVDAEGIAHIKSTLVGASLTIPIENGRMAFGTWQGIFFAEFDGPRRRSLNVSFIG